MDIKIRTAFWWRKLPAAPCYLPPHPNRLLKSFPPNLSFSPLCSKGSLFTPIYVYMRKWGFVHFCYARSRLSVHIYACSVENRCERGIKMRLFVAQNSNISYPSKMKSTPLCQKGRATVASDGFESCHRY